MNSYSVFVSFSQSKALPTLIGSCTILYSAVHQRWLTPREILSVQGFPVCPAWTLDIPCCSFSQRSANGMGYSGWPSRNSVCEMSGNSMHCNVAGVIMLFGMSQVMIDPHLMRLMKTGRSLMIQRRLNFHEPTDTFHQKRKSQTHDEHDESKKPRGCNASELTLFFEDDWSVTVLKICFMCLYTVH